jgi:hypothetical protein
MPPSVVVRSADGRIAFASTVDVAGADQEYEFRMDSQWGTTAELVSVNCYLRNPFDPTERGGGATLDRLIANVRICLS